MGTISIREPSGMLWELVATAAFVDVGQDGGLVANDVELDAGQFRRLKQAMDAGDMVRVTMPPTLGRFQGQIRSLERKPSSGLCIVTLDRVQVLD